MINTFCSVMLVASLMESSSVPFFPSCSSEEPSLLVLLVSSLMADLEPLGLSHSSCLLCSF
jgi:hypothetical protein